MRPSRPYSSIGSRRFLALAATLVIAFLIGCSKSQPLEPLQPAPESGAVVTGVALEDGGARAGVVVTLEAMVDDLPVSVHRAIQAAAAHGGTAPASAASAIRTTVSDAAGRFQFTGIADGEYLVTGLMRHYRAGSERITVTAAQTETTFVNIHLKPTGTFTGVTTLENGTDHTGIVMFVPNSSSAAITQANGAWWMTDVPIGTSTLTGMYPGYLQRSTNGTLSFAGDSIAVPSLVLPLNRNISPTANASASTVCGANPVSLTGNGSDVDGTIALYEWDFEDDGITDYVSPSTGNTSHVYGPGTYQARLTVRDDDGGIGVAITPVMVNGVDSIFVATTGSPAGPGTKANPYSTVSAGISAAAALPPSACAPLVVVATGTYTETVVFAAGVQVAGGFTAGTWTRTPGNYSVLNGGAVGATAPGITVSTRIRYLDIRAAAGGAPGANSVGLYVNGSNSNLIFEDCRFQSANGGAGTAGPAGPNGGLGGNAGNGQVGNSGGSGGGGGGGGGTAGSPGGFPGGNGGLGGYDNGTGVPGAPGGSPSGCNTGGPGGPSSGTCFVNSSNGGTGSPGCLGTNGSNGPGATAGGTVSGGFWLTYPGNAGLPGTGGRGGSGGGGGGGGSGDFPCSADRAGGGGGGGGGGGAGSQGQGGQGGGASLAVFLLNSSPQFIGCRFQTATGGNGGAGGNGGTGGNGGNLGGGGPGADTAGGGGNGGAGGKGGGGGAGSGGNGGGSIGLAASIGSTITHSGSTFLIGSGGSGGFGGLAPAGGAASSGSTGASANTVQLTVAQPVDRVALKPVEGSAR